MGSHEINSATIIRTCIYIYIKEKHKNNAEEKAKEVETETHCSQEKEESLFQKDGPKVNLAAAGPETSAVLTLKKWVQKSENSEILVFVDDLKVYYEYGVNMMWWSYVS